jgi:hypothetical protein
MKISWILPFVAINANCIERNTESVNADGSCNCYEGIFGERCEKIDYDLQCDQSFVTVTAPMATFERIGLADSSKLRLNDENCRGSLTAIDGTEYVKFTITGSPAECGAEVTSNGTYIRYQNYIRDNDVTNDPTVATRSQVQIGFACEFPVDYRVALPAIMPTVSTVAVQTSRGKFVVSMDMFDSESFDNKLDLRNDEVSIAKGEWLHLEMNLRTVVHQDSANLIAEQCWATPVAQPHSKEPKTGDVYHNILMNGCPADSSVAMFANGQNDKVRFKVQMFGFNGEYADNNVWLHCVVRVCGDDCEKDCGMRRRRATDNIDDMPTRYTDIAVVTSPRIMVTDEIDVEIEEVEELKPFIEESADGTVVYVLSAILVIVLAAILVAALMIHQKSRSPLLEHEVNDAPQKKSNGNAGTAFSAFQRM